MNKEKKKLKESQAELDYIFQQLQTQMNEIKAVANQTDDKSPEKEDIGSELFLIQTLKTSGGKERHNSINDLIEDFNMHKKETLLINYNQEPSKDNTKLKTKAINEVLSSHKYTNNCPTDGNYTNKRAAYKIFGPKKDVVNHPCNKKYLDPDNIIEKKISFSHKHKYNKLFTENNNKSPVMKKRKDRNNNDNIDEQYFQSRTKYNSDNYNNNLYVDPNDIIIEEKENHKHITDHRLNKIDPNIPLKLKRLTDFKLTNEHCNKSCETEKEKILKSINASNLLNGIKIALSSNQNNSQNPNSNKYHKKTSSCSSSKNHAISQLSFDIFNSPQDTNSIKGNNKITFLTHTSFHTPPLVIKSSERKFHLITTFDININDEQSYNNYKSISMKEDYNSSNSLTLRNGIISNSYFSSCITASRTNNANYKYNYIKIIQAHYDSIKDKYSFLYTNINIEEQKAMFNEIVGKESMELYSQHQLEKGKLCVSSLYTKKDFINVYNYQSNSPINNNNDIGFDYYRKFETDGNSFYCSFMFAYVEHLIIFKRKDDLMALFVDILRVSDICPIPTLIQNIDFGKLMTLFALVSDLVKSGDYKTAYKCFIYSCVDPQISIVIHNSLLMYIKVCLFGFLSQENINEDFTNDEYDDIVKNTKIARDNILEDQKEPSQLVLKTIPFLFNVKLKIFYLEGERYFAQMKCIDYIRLNNDSNINGYYNDQNAIIICLGNFYSNYNCVYSKDFYQTNTLFREVNHHNIIQDQIEISISRIETKCIKCNINTKRVNFNLNKQKTCLDCLMKAINRILLQRAIYFVKEGYSNLEYYSRSINFNNNQLRISNSDLITISNSIPTLLSNIIKSLCFNCFNKKQKVYSLSCSCQICQECLLTIVKTATNNNIILNCAENKSIQKISCVCKKTFNYSEAIQFFSNTILVEESIKAKVRLIQYVSRTCLICLEDRFDDNIDNKEYRKFKIVLIPIDQKIKGIDYIDTDHTICSTCFIKTNNNKYEDLENQSKSVSKYKGMKKIHCNICNIFHFIEKRDWIKKDNSDLCSENCLVY